MDLNNIPEGDINAAPAKKFAKTRFLFKAATSPVWAPTKLAFKAAAWGIRRQSTAAKILTPTFAAAALATYLGAASYAAVYGVVAAGDYYWFGQPYDSGNVTGRISRLSQVGKFPCNSVEGQLALPNLGPDGSSTFYFSARSMAGLNAEVIQQLEEAYKTQNSVSLTFKRSHYPREWFNPESEGWYLPHITGFNCYQKTDTNIVGVARAAGTPNQEPPRLIPGQPN